MIETFRRLLLAALALACSFALLRPQLSSALVARADTLAFWGDRAGARSLYRRAIAFDANNGVALDRYAFAAAISRDRHALEDALVVSSSYMSEHPFDERVRLDRALCYQHLGRLAEAGREFERTGQHSRDARSLLFAALDQRALGHRKQSVAILREALIVDPHFRPARRDLDLAQQ